MRGLQSPTCLSVRTWRIHEEVYVLERFWSVFYWEQESVHSSSHHATQNSNHTSLPDQMCTHPSQNLHMNRIKYEHIMIVLQVVFALPWATNPLPSGKSRPQMFGRSSSTSSSTTPSTTSSVGAQSISVWQLQPTCWHSMLIISLVPRLQLWSGNETSKIEAAPPSHVCGCPVQPWPCRIWLILKHTLVIDRTRMCATFTPLAPTRSKLSETTWKLSKGVHNQDTLLY